jgi:hypothetical protein
VSEKEQPAKGQESENADETEDTEGNIYTGGSTDEPGPEGDGMRPKGFRNKGEGFRPKEGFHPRN